MCTIARRDVSLGSKRDDGGTAIDAALADRPIDSLTDPPIDAPPIDGPVDAPTDAAGCGTDLRFVGEYLDWDSTNANFIGVGGATFTVVGDTNRTATTSPNGSLLMCLNPAAPSQLTIGAGGYVNALMLVDPAVFAPAGSRFEARALVEVLPQQDQYEDCPIALRALALARLVPSKRR